MKKSLIKLAFVFILIYSGILLYFYTKQEAFIFNAHQVPVDSVYHYIGNVQDKFIELSDGTNLHTATFYPDSSIGFILYFHGNYHGIYDTHRQAYVFVELGYTVFMPDYRNFGKSEGQYINETQFFQDVDELYLYAKDLAGQHKIAVVGYSLGGAPATFVAAKYETEKLVLKAAFYSAKYMQEKTYPFLPSALLKYPFRNDLHIQQVEEPIILIHGDMDKIVPIESAYLLQKHFKKNDRLIILKNEDHLELDENEQYRNEIKSIFGAQN